MFVTQQVDAFFLFFFCSVYISEAFNMCVPSVSKESTQHRSSLNVLQFLKLISFVMNTKLKSFLSVIKYVCLLLIE